MPNYTLYKFLPCFNLGPIASSSLGDKRFIKNRTPLLYICLLYTSDAADDMQCVDLGGRRIIKKGTLRVVAGLW